MKDDKIKQLLSSELDKLAPSMSEKLKNAPIITKDTQVQESKEKVISVAKARNSKRAIWYAMSAVVVVVIAVSILLGMFGNRSNPEVPFVPTYSAGFIQMDINPSFDIVYDKDFKVVSIKSGNEDGDLIISDKEWYNSLIGKQVEQVIGEVAERAGELGYIQTADDLNAVRIISVSGSETQDEKILQSVKDTLEDKFMQRGIYCAVYTVKEDVSYIAQKYDTVAQNIEQAVAQVSEKANSYFEQKAIEAGDDLKELQAYYEVQLYDYLKQQLMLECEKIKKTRELLQQASDINDKILAYNGSLIIMDYWYCKQNAEMLKDPELEKLCSQMTQKLDEIATLRESEIEDYKQFIALKVAYDYIIDEEWIYDIGNATIDELKDGIVWIIDGLEKINAEFAHLITQAISDIPDTVSEYLEASKQILSYTEQILQDKYSEIYNAQRTELSKDDYEKYYNDIISEYGSLQNYWTATRK